MKMILKTDSHGMLPTAAKGLKMASIALLAGVMLSACGGSGDTAATGERSAFEVPGDHAVGNPNAPITVVEYASVTCGHCANWHASVWPQMQKDYVDTGKVRFIYREFPTPPMELAVRGFLIANCAPEEKFFANISLQYERQQAMVNSRNRAADYEALAKASGLSPAEYETCVSTEENYNRLNKVVEGGQDAGVTGTPAFFINGVMKKVYKIEDFDKEFADFVEVPERKAADADAKTAGE